MATPVPAAAPFKINATGTFADSSATAVLADGTFVFAWIQNSYTVDPLTGVTTYVSSVLSQRFYANGEKFGAEVVIESLTSNENKEYLSPDIVGLKDGGYAVSWDKDGDVHLRAFDARGQGGTAVTAPQIHGYEGGSSLTALNDGGFALAYASGNETLVTNAFQRYDAQGQAVGNVVAHGGGTLYGMATLQNGNYVAVTEEGSSIRGYVLQADGTAIDDAGFLVNDTLGSRAFKPTVTVLADGRFVVAYTERTLTVGDGSGYAVMGRIYASDGTPVGDEFQINITERDYQRFPSIAALPNGGFAVAYQDMLGLDGPLPKRVASLMVVAFDRDGHHDGAELVVAQGGYYNGLETFALSALPDGRLVITWTDIDNFRNPSSSAQILDPRIDPLDWIGTSGSDNFVGTRLGDRLKGAGGEDRLYGGEGNDDLNGGDGADLLDGGDGVDVASYGDAKAGVAIDLSTQSGTAGEADGDTFRSVEKLIGSSHNDRLGGDGGDNELTGGAGADILTGRAGDDVYRADSSDQIVEAAGEGTDTVLASGSFTLARLAEVEILSTDNAFGFATMDLAGSDTANKVTGNLGRNTLSGLGGADILSGEAGDDRLLGGLGNDVLGGGEGRDTFVFDTKIGRANIDRVSDFSVKDDSIQLENKIFSKLGQGSASKPGKLSADAFLTGTSAKDAEDRIIYNKKTGVLYYDADGTGSAKQVSIATLDKKLKLTAADFFVI